MGGVTGEVDPTGTGHESGLRQDMSGRTTPAVPPAPTGPRTGSWWVSKTVCSSDLMLRRRGESVLGAVPVGLEEARTSASRGDIGGSERSSESADAAAAW